MNTGKLRNGFWDRLRAAWALLWGKQAFVVVRVVDVVSVPGEMPTFNREVFLGYSTPLEAISLVVAAGDGLRELAQDNMEHIYGVPYREGHLQELLKQEPLM